MPMLHSNSLLTRIRDCQGRLWLFRSFVGQGIKKLLGEFTAQAQALVKQVEANSSGFKESDMRGNARGSHWFSIFGHDRNNKKVCNPRLESNSDLTYSFLYFPFQVPDLSAWHKRNHTAINTFFDKNGAAWRIK
jgi:hypothetical protein